MNKAGRQSKINPFVLVILSFLGVILIGSILLTFPFSNTLGEGGKGIWLWNTTTSSGQHFTYVDCLFTAVSCTCVTGASTYQMGFADSLTFAGQLISLLMIKIGGLGFITILTFIITLFKSKLQFKNRYYFSQMVSATNFADVAAFVRKLIIISAIFEVLGFLLGLPVFFTIFPNDVPKALWNSAFHSISAFNNAGFNLAAGSTSFINGISINGGVFLAKDTFLYYYFCSYMMLLILAGGISFLTLIEIFTSGKKPKQYRSFTKIVLLMSFIIIFVGAFGIFFADGFKTENPITLFDSFFQIISSRTAGFSTYKVDDLSLVSKTICCLAMFFGGAPLGTAGGIKVTTIYVVFLAIFCFLRGKKVSSFKRSYSNTMVVKAMTITFIGIILVLLGFVLISTFGFEGFASYEAVQEYAHTLGPTSSFDNTNASIGLLFEVFSCFGTTGFTVGFEPYMSMGSKIVLCCLMFIGRLGPMTFFQIFQKSVDANPNEHYKLVEEDFLVG